MEYDRSYFVKQTFNITGALDNYYNCKEALVRARTELDEALKFIPPDTDLADEIKLAQDKLVNIQIK